MELRITISGEVVGRQELLNGTQTVTLAGNSDDGRWMFFGEICWNRGLVDFAGEGEFTLTRGDDNDEIFATASAVEVLPEEPDDASVRLHAAYEIDGGSGEFANATGTATADLTIASDIFSGSWTLMLV